jgi:hypothetical protein
MTPSTTPEATVVLSSFFRRLEPLEEIVRVFMSQARMSALFTFRGTTDSKVLLDFSKSPAVVAVDNGARSGDVSITINGGVMHDIFLERMKPGVALGRREMLLRGPVSDLSKILPLFGIAPMLYREHLGDIGYNGYAREPGKSLSQEELMNGQVFKGEAIPLVQLSGPEKVGTKLINGLAYGLGYVVGLLRYRLFKKLSLFGVLTAMSTGLTKATPPELKTGT